MRHTGKFSMPSQVRIDGDAGMTQPARTDAATAALDSVTAITLYAAADVLAGIRESIGDDGMDNSPGMEVVCRHADGFRGRILDKDTGVVLGEAQK